MVKSVRSSGISLRDPINVGFLLWRSCRPVWTIKSISNGWNLPAALVFFHGPVRRQKLASSCWYSRRSSFCHNQSWRKYPFFTRRHLSDRHSPRPIRPWQRKNLNSSSNNSIDLSSARTNGRHYATRWTSAKLKRKQRSLYSIAGGHRRRDRERTPAEVNVSLRYSAITQAHPSSSFPHPHRRQVYFGSHFKYVYVLRH